MVIAGLHSVFGLIRYREQWHQVFSDGFVAAAKTPSTKLAVWFVLFGMAFAVIASLSLSLEKAGLELPQFGVWVLISLTAVGLMLIPLSGFWLILPPLLAMLLDHRRTHIKKTSTA